MTASSPAGRHAMLGGLIPIAAAGLGALWPEAPAIAGMVNRVVGSGASALMVRRRPPSGDSRAACGAAPPELRGVEVTHE